MSRLTKSWAVNRSRWLLLICVWAVASVQLALVSTTDLTRWRGGGFGMYSDPHPDLARMVWLVGHRDGQERAVRLWPMDDRLKEATKKDWKLREDLGRLRDVAGRSRNFPSARGTDGLRREIDFLLQKPESHQILGDFFPKENLHRVIVELGISEDWQTVERRVIAEDPLVLEGSQSSEAGR